MRSPKPFTVYQPVPAKARSRSSPSTPIRSIRRGLERKTMEVAVDGLIGANIVSVSIVATAAVRSSANGSRAYRCRSYTVAPIAVAAIAAPIAVAMVACAAHRNSAAASRSSNCDRTAAITAATPIGTSAAPSLGIIGDQAGGEQNESCKRSKNEAEHDRNPSMNSLSPAREIAALSAQELDVDQSNPRTAATTLCSAAPEKAMSLSCASSKREVRHASEQASFDQVSDCCRDCCQRPVGPCRSHAQSRPSQCGRVLPIHCLPSGLRCSGRRRAQAPPGGARRSPS